MLLLGLFLSLAACTEEQKETVPIATEDPAETTEAVPETTEAPA